MPTYSGRGLLTPVSIANGGTNATSFTTTNGVVKYDGTRLVTGLLTDDATNVTLASGTLITPNGTAGAPSVTFGDATTGFYRPAADRIGVTTAGVLKWIFYEAAGNIGAAADNLYDLGFATGNRPRTTFLGTSLLVNTTAASALHADAPTMTVGIVANTNSGPNPLGIIANTGTSSGATFVAAKTRSAIGTDAASAVASGDDILYIQSFAADGGAYRNVAQISTEVDTYTGSDNVSGRIGVWTRPDGASGVLALRGGWGKTGAQMLGADFEGGATTSARVIQKVQSIADAVATDVFTVTVPNDKQSAGILVTLVSSNGSTDDAESSRVAQGLVVVARTSGANAVATAAALTLTAIATVAAGATHTLAYGVSAISGAAGATNTFTIQVTIDDSGNVGSNEVVAVAELINSKATGVTIA